MAMGPFPVGVKTIVLYDQNRLDPKTSQPRKLVTEIWYPAVQAAKDGPFDAYDFLDKVHRFDWRSSNDDDQSLCRCVRNVRQRRG